MRANAAGDSRARVEPTARAVALRLRADRRASAGPPRRVASPRPAPARARGAATGGGRRPARRNRPTRRRRGGHRRRLRRGTGSGAGGSTGAGGSRERRQEEQRIEVARSGRAARRTPRWTYGHGQLGDAARADRPDRAALGDSPPRADDDRAEMQQRDRVAVRRLDRDRLARPRHGAGEGDDPAPARRTCAPAGAPMSMPRCWPAAYGSSPKRKGCRTGPCTGQAHAERRCRRDERGEHADEQRAARTETSLLSDLQTTTPR